MGFFTKNTQLTIGEVISHRSPRFLELNGISKRDFSMGIGSATTNHWYIPTVAYEVDGVPYQVEVRIAYRGYKYLEIGRKVNVTYKTDNPKKIKIKAFKND